jgi:ATP adenylyltransferase
MNEMDHLWTPWRMAYLRGEDPVPEGCIFCNKLKAEDDAAEHILTRGERAFVILNRYPYNNGHLMVVPYKHVASLEDLDAATRGELMDQVTRSLKALRAASKPDGFNIGVNIGQVAGAGVADHVHLHVVPRWGGDTNYMPIIGNTRVIPELLDETYRQLKAVWSA